MSISYLLVFLGLAAFGGAVWALFWAVDAGQYDDLEAQGRAILDDPPAAGPATSEPRPREYPSQSS
jgi:cbb3-type cytochrome oxidase maturation protein